MTSDEIVADLNARNRSALFGREDHDRLSTEEVLALMDGAAMQGFKLGSNVALSMVKGSLLVQLNRAAAARGDRSPG